MHSLTPAADLPPAVNQLAAALEAQPLTILALGPATNIALLLQRRPDLARRIRSIIAVAGQRPGQVFKVGRTPLLHFHDLNVRQDPDAFAVLLRSGVALHLVPFEVGRQATVKRADLAILNTRGRLDRWLGGRSVAWLDFWEGTLGAAGFAPFDTLAVAYLAELRHFSCTAMAARIVRRRGLFVSRDTMEVAAAGNGGFMVTFCWGLAKSLRNSLVDFLAHPDRPNKLATPLSQPQGSTG